MRGRRASFDATRRRNCRTPLSSTSTHDRKTRLDSRRTALESRPTLSSRGRIAMSNDQNPQTVPIGVELTAADWKLKTTISAPAGPRRLIDLLPLANALADAVTGMAEQALKKQGEEISCRKGCAACCRSMVPISEVEARRLRELVESLS